MKIDPKTSHRKNERGNVLFYILIAVVLFAALNFVVGGMMRGGNADMVGEEQAKLFAGEILDYARILKGAIQDMRISNECSEEEFRFIDSQITGYGTSVRTDCDVFNINGGDVRYIQPSDKWLDSNFSSNDLYREYFFTGMTSVSNVGNNTQHLILFLPYLKLEVCNAINEKLNTSHTSGNPPIENSDAWHAGILQKFDGNYTGPHTRAIDGQGPIRTSGCREGGGSPPANSYFFYQVLLPR